ncbi:hypothetical protein [uncultured Agrococcus sp.]|uniref:hypothetical protein n=1 Tax=uncultured Agrococcus sp. TaxID=382258 RepID=UPI0025F743C1|nr:hypothetical protein [uncultured Agrococcus sp.]
MRIRTGKNQSLVTRVLAIIAVAGLAAVSNACAQEEQAAPQPTSHTEYRELTNEWAEDFVQCLRDKGVDARVVTQEDGSVSVDPAYAPGTDFDELWNGLLDPDCIEAAGEPPELPAATEDFKIAAYELISEQAECLRENGYVVGDAPSVDEWIEQWDGARWDPVGEAGENGYDIFELTEHCPDPTGIEIEERMLENLGEDGSVE